MNLVRLTNFRVLAVLPVIRVRRKLLDPGDVFAVEAVLRAGVQEPTPGRGDVQLIVFTARLVFRTRWKCVFTCFNFLSASEPAIGLVSVTRTRALPVAVKPADTSLGLCGCAFAHASFAFGAAGASLTHLSFSAGYATPMVTAVPSAAPMATVLTMVFTDVVDLVLMPVLNRCGARASV